MEAKNGNAELTKKKGDCVCEWGLRENLLFLILQDINTICYCSKQGNNQTGLYNQLMKNKALIALIAQNRNNPLISKRWIVRNLPSEARLTFNEFLTDLLPNIDLTMLKMVWKNKNQTNWLNYFTCQFKSAIDNSRDNTESSNPVYLYMAGIADLIMFIELHKEDAIMSANTLPARHQLPVMQFIDDIFNKQLTTGNIKQKMEI